MIGIKTLPNGQTFLVLDKDKSSDGQVLNDIASALEGHQYGDMYDGRRLVQLSIPVNLIHKTSIKGLSS